MNSITSKVSFVISVRYELEQLEKDVLEKPTLFSMFLIDW